MFVAVRPDVALADELQRLSPAVRRVKACELDEVRAANLAADLEATLGGEWRVEPLASSRPGDVATGTEGPPICFSPRAWAALDQRARSAPRAVRVRYVIEPESIKAAALRLFAPATGSGAAI